jgi:hypothetical protein
LHVGEPYIDVTPTVTVTRGRPSVPVQNIGNAPAVGLATIELFESSDAAMDDTDTLIVGVTKFLKIKSGRAKAVKVKVAAKAGFYLFAKLTWVGAPSDSNAGNNVGVVQVA